MLFRCGRSETLREHNLIQRKQIRHLFGAHDGLSLIVP